MRVKTVKGLVFLVQDRQLCVQLRQTGTLVGAWNGA